MEDFSGIAPHRPLSSILSEIRVVDILPGVFGTPVRCHLQHIDCDIDRNYEAVSYCWGERDPKSTRYITLDGVTYPVTVNLYDGLQYLRSEHVTRRLWIDSLCINQTDIAERSREVQKMRDIYRSAADVLIWLGDYKPFTCLQVQNLFGFVRKLVKFRSEKNQKKLVATEGLETLWGMQEQLAEFIKSRQWFERMWIIQEVAVRPPPPIGKPEGTPPHLICGHLALPFVYLRAAHKVWCVFANSSQPLLPSVKLSFDELCDVWSLKFIRVAHHDRRRKCVLAQYTTRKTSSRGQHKVVVGKT